MKPKQISATINNKSIHTTHFNTYQNARGTDVYRTHLLMIWILAFLTQNKMLGSFAQDSDGV